MTGRLSSEDLEVISGKHRGTENFPVASLLIRPAHRPVIRAFYDFARTTDDIADTPTLDPDEKLRRLGRYAAGLAGEDPDPPGKALRLRTVLLERGVPLQHGLDLVEAFRMDAVRTRYGDCAALMGYCALSAEPVGRFLLDLHGEDRDLWPASDGLCSALQILNHLQDMGEDFLELDRVYLAQDWMAEAGASVEELGASVLSSGLRAVVDRHLGVCEALLGRAEALAGGVRDRRLAAEVRVVLRVAWRLAGLLRVRDPLAGRVRLGWLDRLWCFGGVWARGAA